MELHHKVLYDPAKAHEYYLRTRQLKGRRKGSSNYTVNLGGGKKVQLTAQQLTEQRAYATKRISEIKTRLDELKNELRKMMGEAKKKDAQAKRKAGKPQTAAEKAKAAKESKQFRQKHHQKLATQKKTAAKKQPAKKHKTAVAELEHKINEVKGRLTAAVARQRALASATRGS